MKNVPIHQVSASQYPANNHTSTLQSTHTRELLTEENGLKEVEKNLDALPDPDRSLVNRASLTSAGVNHQALSVYPGAQTFLNPAHLSFMVGRHVGARFRDALSCRFVTT